MTGSREWIELAARGIEGLAVALMIILAIIGTGRWIYESLKGREYGYKNYRVALGKALLIGLELLVAADIIQTVAIDSTLLSIAMLAGLVIVRTFLGWTVALEVEGCWPWQGKGETTGASAESAE